jgi:hypothetical protein
MRCADACFMYEEMRNAYTVLVRKPEGKKPLSRPRHRRDDIKVGLKKQGMRMTGFN